MTEDWTLYEKLLGGGSTASERDVIIDGAVSSFFNGAVNDPAYQEHSVVNGKDMPLIVTRTSTVRCAIKAMPDSDICVGDVVKCLGEDWLIVELYADKIGIINGEMWLCNNTIVFQNNSDKVNVRPCVVDSGAYAKKTSDPYAFVMANTYKVYMSIDDETRQIYVDKRLGFGEIYSQTGEKILEVYKVIGVDLKSGNGGAGSHLMILTMQRDVYNSETDSLAYNICDVYKANSVINNPTGAGRCTVVGKDNIRVGTTRKYSAEYTDVNGISVANINTVWDVSSPIGVEVSIEGCSCIISVPLDSALIGETIAIRATDSAGVYGNFEKKVQVISVG